MPCGSDPAIMRPASMHKIGRSRFPPANTLCRIALWIDNGCVVSKGISRSSEASVNCCPCRRVSFNMTRQYNKHKQSETRGVCEHRKNGTAPRKKKKDADWRP